jgi:two-component system, OmpR family, sensor kinase
MARLAGLLSFRTISGKLIIGLFVLFGLAAAAVSLITAQSLNSSLMASLNGQLQAATQTWLSCVEQMYHGGAYGDGWQGNHGAGSMPNLSGADQPVPSSLDSCSGQGQAPHTFEVLLASGSVTYKNYVNGTCKLSPADTATLVSLSTDTLRHPSGPSGSSSTPGSPGSPPPAPTYIRKLDAFGSDFLLTKVAGPDGSTLVTGLPLGPVDAELAHVETTENLVFAAAALLAVVLGAGLVQLSLRPLRRVAATATQVTELPLDSGEVTLPVGVPDHDPRTEVGQVGAAFNRMLLHVERALGRRAASESRLRRFAADASHELRTPLSAIRGYAELAMRHPGPVPDDVTHALSRVQSESARMGVLVDDLLLLARLDAGRPLERAPVDLSRLAIDATSDARAARADHHWRLDLPGDPILVLGDEHRLHQVLANLMGNAGKHTPPGSTVSVVLRVTGPAAGPRPGPADLGDPADRRDSRQTGQDGGVVSRGVRPSGRHVELSITDDGPGIPPALLPELFERFTRADTSRARDTGAAGTSTGLGLAIVDAVVAAHGGSITVTSRPGLTRFAIFLPPLPQPPDSGQAFRA